MKKIFDTKQLQAVSLKKELSQEDVLAVHNWIISDVKNNFPELTYETQQPSREKKGLISYDPITYFKKEGINSSIFILWFTIPYIYHLCMTLLKRGEEFIVYDGYQKVESFFLLENEQDIKDFILRIFYSGKFENITVYTFKKNYKSFISEDCNDYLETYKERVKEWLNKE